MHRTERNAWFDWLNRRALITAAAERLAHNTGGSTDHNDRAALEQAPRTIHLGMRDPHWRIGGTPATPADTDHQLTLTAA